MNIKRRLKNVVKNIEPNNTILTKIKTQCGIPNVKLNVKKPFYSTMLFKTLTPIMACLVLAITCVSVVFAMPKKTSDSSYVLLDIGSLVALKMNDEKVEEHCALNESAQVLMLNCNYQNQDLDFTILDIVDNAKELGILTEDQHIHISTFVQKKNHNLMESDLYKQMNHIYNEIGDKFIIDNTYATKEELIKNITEKYTLDESSIKNQAFDDLIKIYVNHNSETAKNFEEQIKEELDNLRQQNMENLNNDFSYKKYNSICEKLQIILTHLELLKENPNDQMLSGINELITYLNFTFGTKIDSAEATNEFSTYIENYLQTIKQKIQAKINEYNQKYDNMSLIYRKNLINELNRTQMRFFHFNLSNNLFLSLL